MAAVAASGDASAVNTRFGKPGKACDSCHDKFRKEFK
jgi:cytochrome c556